MLPRASLHAPLLFAALALTPAPAQDSRPSTRPSSMPAVRQPAGGNMLFNGDFELRGEEGKLPAGWSTRHPDNVRLIDPGGPRGDVVEMTGGRKLMASYGVDLTGREIPVKPNTRYRCTGYTKSTGPNIKIFIKGYATVTRRVEGELRTFDDIVYQMRKDIAPSADWQPFKLEFVIKPSDIFSDFQHEVCYVRVRLWAFWPVGTCWFDEIRFEELGPVAASERRHGEAVTHVGVPPRLGAAARDAATTQGSRFDQDQVWRDAVNAFRNDHYAQAARLAERLIAHAPQKGAYHLLAARAAAELAQWSEAERQARWLLEEVDPAVAAQLGPRQVESWQRDWAHVVRAKVCAQTGRCEEARAILRALLQADASLHARAAGEQLLAELKRTDPQD